jgi:hypothetical protein
MKTKIATALSLVGVLGAGSAAALVNTQILDGGTPASASAELLVPAASLLPASTSTLPELTTIPTTTLAPTTSGVPVTAAEIVQAVPQPTVATPTGYLTAYNVGEAGVVTVDVIAGDVVLVAAEPSAGWTVSDSEADSEAARVQVSFTDGTTEVEFEVVLYADQLVPHVESRSLTGGGSESGTSNDTSGAGSGSDDTTRTTIDDDDGSDDDHESDDHESDDHGGDDELDDD